MEQYNFTVRVTRSKVIDVCFSHVCPSKENVRKTKTAKIVVLCLDVKEEFRCTRLDVVGPPSVVLLCFAIVCQVFCWMTKMFRRHPPSGLV